jgi:hypothetical protein
MKARTAFRRVLTLAGCFFVDEVVQQQLLIEHKHAIKQLRDELEELRDTLMILAVSQSEIVHKIRCFEDAKK